MSLFYSLVMWLSVVGCRALPDSSVMRLVIVGGHWQSATTRPHGLSQCRYDKARKQIASHHKPHVKQTRKDKRTRSSLAEFRYTSITAKRRHCHGKHECRHYFYHLQRADKPCLTIEVGMQKTVYTYHEKENKGKPRHDNLLFLDCTLYCITCFLYLRRSTTCRFQRKTVTHNEQYRHKHHHTHHLYYKGRGSYLLPHGVSCTHNVCHLMQCGSSID